MHLLVKHSGSRRPASWRSDHITRSKDDARNILNGEGYLLVSLVSVLFISILPLLYLSSINHKYGLIIPLCAGYAKEINEQSCLAEKRAKFRALAKEFSDCSSASKGGDLGVSQGGIGL